MRSGQDANYFPLDQKLHAWPFAMIKELLTYKAKLAGIRVSTISEAYTSQSCPLCGKRHKADLVGAYNILKR